MSLAVRDRTDPWPDLPVRCELQVTALNNAEAMAAIQCRSVSEMTARFAEGHRAYVAWRDGVAAAFGWVATRSARIGELDFTFRIPRRERYLWNFVTLPAHRGVGIYPRLLNAIVAAESDARRFWVAYAPENAASAAGIVRAGFTVVADLSFDAGHRPAVRDRVPGGGRAAATLLGLPHIDEELAPCWRCVRAGRSAEAACRAGACCCDYQQPALACEGTLR